MKAHTRALSRLSAGAALACLGQLFAGGNSSMAFCPGGSLVLFIQLPLPGQSWWIGTSFPAPSPPAVLAALLVSFPGRICSSPAAVLDVTALSSIQSSPLHSKKGPGWCLFLVWGRSGQTLWCWGTKGGSQGED